MTPTPQPQEAVIPTEGDALLPCPFCGGEAEIIHLDDADNAGGSCVCCTKCQASGNVEFGRKENFVANWNHRAKPSTREAEAPVSEAVAWPDEIDLFRIMRRAGRSNAEKAKAVAAYLQTLFDHPAPSPASAWKPGREAVARAIDPAAFLFGPDELDTKTYNNARDYAFERADRVLALPTPPATEGAGDE